MKYLSRYVFRIAITNARLVSMDETHVTFRYKDHDTGEKGADCPADRTEPQEPEVHRVPVGTTDA